MTLFWRQKNTCSEYGCIRLDPGKNQATPSAEIRIIYRGVIKNAGVFWGFGGSEVKSLGREAANVFPFYFFWGLWVMGLPAVNVLKKIGSHQIHNTHTLLKGRGHGIFATQPQLIYNTWCPVGAKWTVVKWTNKWMKTVGVFLLTFFKHYGKKCSQAGLSSR